MGSHWRVPPLSSKLDEAEETQFISGGSGQSGYEQDQMLSWPYYGLGGGAGFGMGGVGMMRDVDRPVVVTNDRVPLGEVEVRRGEHVSRHRRRNRAGPRAGHPPRMTTASTHVLLDEGHLWGQKRVAIPISAVQDVAAGVRLNLTKGEVRTASVEVDEDVSPEDQN